MKNQEYTFGQNSQLAKEAKIASCFNNEISKSEIGYAFSNSNPDMNSLKLILIAAIAILPSFFIPQFQKYVDIAIRSSIVGGIFILLTLKLEATPELNNKIRKNLKRFNITFI